MKISETHRVTPVNPYTRQQQEAARVSVSGRKSNKDEVRISPEAKQLLGTQNGQTDHERRLKINALKQAVSTGTYSVEAGKIAEKLLPHLFEL